MSDPRTAQNQRIAEVAQRPSEPARARVWLLEDSPMQAQRVQADLRNRFDVTWFTNGATMLEQLARETHGPDVLLLDWELPELSGVDVLEHVRASYDAAVLPVLMLTAARADADGVLAALDVGANDFVAKPYVPAELLARLSTLVRVRLLHNRARAAEQAQADALMREAATAAQLHEREAELQLVIDALPVLVSFVTADECYGLVNRAYEDWFGQPRESIRGRSVRDFVGDEAYALLAPYVRRGLAGESFAFVQHGVPYRHGGTRDVRVTFTAQRDADGNPNGYVAMLEDITEQRQLEAALRRQAEFEQQLIGIVSHDLRNPLSAIVFSTSTLLRHSNPTERQLPALARIAASADRATRMIRDLLDFTRARHGGGLPVVLGPVDLHALVEQVVGEVALAHSDRTIEVHREGDGRGVWDADRVAQVVTNLAGNALKYSPADTPVTITTRGERDVVTITVHNAGAPISAALRPQLFEPMHRGDEQVDRTGRSIGLGLYIVDQIVRAHGGTVAVHSATNEGTTFTVQLPRRPAAA